MNWNSLERTIGIIRKGPRIKDSLTVSIFAGLIGTTLVDVSNAYLWKKGKTEMLYGHFAASMFMRPFRTNQRKNFILGQIFHMMTGATFSLPIFYILKKTGRDNLFLKGIFGGSLVWSTLYAFGIRMKLYTAKPHLTKTHYSYLWHNFLYGIATTFSMVWLADPSMFPHSAQINESPSTFENTQIN